MAPNTVASNDKILDLYNQSKGFVPETADRRPSVFLSLAPATSQSYPQHQRQSVAALALGASEAAAAAPPSAASAAPLAADVASPDEASQVKDRRSSSLSSGGSGQVRILKLGPVHWGEHMDDHKKDWHDVAVE